MVLSALSFALDGYLGRQRDAHMALSKILKLPLEANTTPSFD